MTRKFDIDGILQNPNAKVIIALPSGNQSLRNDRLNSTSSSSANRANAIVGFMTNELVFAGGSNYNNPFESQKVQGSIQAADNLNRAMQETARALGIGTESLPNINLRNISATVANWVSSEKPRFNISFMLIATRAAHDVRADYRRLLDTVYPIFTGIGAGTTLNTPLNYESVLGSNGEIRVRNTIAVSLGRWFRATGQVMKTVSATFSNEVTSSGYPLYAKVDCTFEPFRMISASEAKGYINV